MWLRRGDGDAVADARPAASDAAGRRCRSAASSSGHLRHFGFGRVAGKSTIVATMAHTSSLLGLRAAVLDLDLMFGNLYDLLGADTPHDMATLIEPSAAGTLAESDIVAASMRVASGVTLWGPVAAPEQAELMARPVELLLDVLRRESDVVLVDTSVFWGDAWRLRWRRATAA